MAHRGARESEWSWEHTEEVRAERSFKLPLRTLWISTGIAGGLAAFAFGVFLLATSGNGDAAPPIVNGSSTPTPEATASATPDVTDEPTAVATPTPSPSRTAAPTGSPSPAPTPTPGPSYVVELAGWSEVESNWVMPLHNGSTSNYEEGDYVPFLLRIEDAEPGANYTVEVSYECSTGGDAAFDFLGSDAPDSEPLLTAPGPGSTVPDSVLFIHDDSSIDFDDAPGGSLRAWGAVFSAAEGPTPQTECTGVKTLNVKLLAQDDTIWLVWMGHLASEADWGSSNGAASAVPFDMTVEVNGEVQESFTMGAGSVEP